MKWSILANHSNATSKLTFTLTALAILAVIAVSARAWFTLAADGARTAPAALAQPKAATNPQIPVRLEAVIVTIRPTGFEPDQITRPPGPFLLVVDNRSGLKSVTLKFSQVFPLNSSLNSSEVQDPPQYRFTTLSEVTVPRERLDWSAIENLPPGTYALTEASHADWFCSMAITAITAP